MGKITQRDGGTENLDRKNNQESKEKDLGCKILPLHLPFCWLLNRRLTFSPRDNMEEITVYKDICLFLQKMLFCFLHEQMMGSQYRRPLIKRTKGL